MVAPYIPGRLIPTDKDYIIQSMLFDGVNDLEAVKDDISQKLSQVYLTGKQKVSRKRKKRALGSIDSVVSFAGLTYAMYGVNSNLTNDINEFLQTYFKLYFKSI